MARYGQPIRQDIVDMRSPLNVGFYKELMDTAQSNLNQSTIMGAKFMEDAYGNKYIDPKARDLYIGKAEKMIEDVSSQDFQTPAKMASAVLKASQSLAPWKNVNEKQLELAKQAEAFKLQHGANALMTDPSKQSLLDANGNLISPEQLKFTGMNAEDFDKMFKTSEQGQLTSKFDRRVASDLPFKYKFETVEGMSPEQIQGRYGAQGTEAIRLAEQQIQSSPQILEIFNGDRTKAIDYLRNRNLATAGQFGQSVTSKYLDDDWSLYMAKKKQEAASAPKVETPPTYTPFYPVAAGVTPVQNKSVGATMKNIGGGKEEVKWDSMPFNAQGNLMAVTPARSTFGTSGGTGGAGGYTEKEKVNPQYKEAAIQLFNYKQLLAKQGIRGISDKAALNLMQTATKNSADFYELHNEAVSDVFKGNNFSPFVDASGNFKDAKTAELEVFNPKTNTWENTNYDELSEELGYGNSESVNTKNLSNQLKESSDKVIDYWAGKPKLAGSVVDSKGKAVQVRFNMGNSAAEKFGTPYAQAQNLLLESGSHTISFNNLNVKTTVAPTQVTGPDGSPQIVNRIVDIKVTGDVNNPANAEVVKNLTQSTSPEDALIYYTRNWRDLNYEKHGIVYKSESTKK